MGTQTSNGTPEKRARKLIALLVSFRLCAAVSLMLRMILPSLDMLWRHGHAVNPGIYDDMRGVYIVAHPFVHSSNQVGSF